VLTDEELAALGPVKTVELVETGGQSTGRPAGTESVAAGDLARLRELAAAGPLVLSCRSGIRSAALARLLRAEGVNNIYSRRRAAATGPVH
jgi:adenylyltransferase/sulfurtransferase